MAKQLQLRRVLLLVSVLGIAFLALGYRLVDLQLLRHEELQAKAQEYTVKEILRAPRRGDILDARGNVLATSVFVKTVCADPTLLNGCQPQVARAIAPLLQMSEAELVQKLQLRPIAGTNGAAVTTRYRRYVLLKENVLPETWLQISNAMSRLTFGVDEKKLPSLQQAFYRDLRKASVFTEMLDGQLREYPNKTLAAHVLGFVGKNLNDTNNFPGDEIIGRGGIEETMESKLAGTVGWRVTGVDNKRREVVGMRTQNVEPRDGYNVVLTIDSAIQHILETELGRGMQEFSPDSITGLVLRPRTGEVLAMATLPTYDPNQVGKLTDAHRNRVISEEMEPGSTFKIVTVAGALNEKAVTLSDIFDCENGMFLFGGRKLHDSHPYGLLSVESIITKSSNIGAAKVGIKLGETRLYDYVRRFGFGEETGIPLPYERRIVVRPVDKWSKVTIAQIPMGHGVAVTRLQMALAMCAIANDGVLMKPMLVKRLEDREGNVVAKYQPQRVRQVISEATAKLMVSALKTVTTTNGTAPQAALDQYEVAGKTGTAQKVVGGTYSNDKFFSSFVGFFPADNPEVCISIVLDEPHGQHFGGATAAPVFHNVAERVANYLNIKPDLKDSNPSAHQTAASFPDARTARAVAYKTSNNH